MRDPDWKIKNPRCGCEGPCRHEAEDDEAPAHVCPGCGLDKPPQARLCSDCEHERFECRHFAGTCEICEPLGIDLDDARQ